MSEHTNPVVPGLAALIDEQKEAVNRLLNGFASNRRVLLWCLDVLFLSAGRVDVEAVKALPVFGRDRTATKMVLGDPDPAVGRRYRMKYAGHYILPAFNDALDEVGWSFTEYGEGGPSPEEQKNMAMRPALEELREDQRDVLDRLLDGFGSAEELLEWGSALNRATLGASDPDLVKDALGTDVMLRRSLLVGSEFAEENPQEATWLRHRVARAFLLEWFAEGVERRVGSASEQPEEVETDLEEYELTLDSIVEDSRDGGG
jgi:hypothetical protein